MDCRDVKPVEKQTSTLKTSEASYISMKQEAQEIV
jgi:hypothetical protein